MGSDLKFEFKVDFKPIRQKCYRYRLVNITNEPRLRQYLVLAYQIQEVLDRDSNATSKQIARWLHMTPPRVSQILNLLFLNPIIQKDIFLLNDKKIHDLTEHKILSITREVDWQKQQSMWLAILK